MNLIEKLMQPKQPLSEAEQQRRDAENKAYDEEQERAFREDALPSFNHYEDDEQGGAAYEAFCKLPMDAFLDRLHAAVRRQHHFCGYQERDMVLRDLEWQIEQTKTMYQGVVERAWRLENYIQMIQIEER